MPLMYPIKRVFRNWKLFTALLIGVTLAATFCAAIGVKANLSAEQTLDKQISNVITDISFRADLNQSNLALAYHNVTTVPGVKKVDMVASFSMPISTSSDNYTTSDYTQMASFPNTSRIYNEWENRPYGGIPENYTYVLADSALEQKLHIGDNITTMINFPQPRYYNASSIYVNLTVAGFAELTDTGYALLTNNNGGIVYYGGSGFAPPPIYGGSTSNYRSDMMIVSWENTLQKLWNTTLDSSTASVTFSVNVDRQKLISPWNVETSIANVNAISENIQNQILANYLVRDTYVNNMLSSSLYGYQSNFQVMLINFVVVSIPVFFVAWYLGSTVSDVSFNIRRREIGLLSTKGLSSGQIQRIFLTEALVIGLIGGALGVVGGLIINQYYLGTVNLNNLFASQIFSPEIAVVTIVFGVVLALTSVFWSSRKASRMPAVDALREYLPVENKPRFRFVPWIALIMGSYKIVVFALGINILTIVNQWNYSRGNFFLSIFTGPLVIFDAIMTYFGPFLFFWGLTKVLIRDSDRFQRIASKISSVMGDLGALAAKNVRRNPARLAAVAFLIAFIIGFSVQVTGQVASQQDFIVRSVHQQVGADVTVSVVNASKAQVVLDDIVGNVSGIRNATIERTMYAALTGGNSYNQMQLRTIDPDTWASSAYYEQGWFTGTSVDQMMKELKASNNTIIIDQTLAKQLNLKLYDEVGIDFNSCPRKLRIIGFFGPEPAANSANVVINGGLDGSKYISTPINVYSQYYSYVPANLFNMSQYSGIYTVESFQTKYLISLNPGVNGTEMANQIRSVDPTEIVAVDSFDQEWQQSASNKNIGTYSNLQILDVQGLGLVFAVLSASVGTALIAIVSLKERSREATLMSVRGLSYRQLVWMFLAESMATITFSVVLGVVVGVIIVYGTVTSANSSLYTSQLVMQRLVYPLNALATIGTYIALIYASTTGSILVMTSQYVTKLEKMVRAR
jgi:ABC-type antimicrobial peptide transport system permease subunit